MSRIFALAVSCALFAIGLIAARSARCAEVGAANYVRAERFLSWNRHKYLPNADVQPHWIHGQDRFWYRRTDARGSNRFVVVDAASGSRAPAFDQARVAPGLSRALARHIAADELPFSTFRYVQQGHAIEFSLADKLWSCRTDRTACLSRSAPAADSTAVLSPDGKWAAFLRDYDLWIRATDGTGEVGLTSDGEQYDGYAVSPGNSVLADGPRRAGLVPALLWSPDSTKILTHRLDERDVAELAVMQAVPEDGSVRPKLLRYRYAMANDEHKASLLQVVF